MEPYLAPDVSFRIVYDDFGVSASNEEQLEAMKHLEFIPWQVWGLRCPHMHGMCTAVPQHDLCHAQVSMEEQVSQTLADCLAQQAYEAVQGLQCYRATPRPLTVCRGLCA